MDIMGTTDDMMVIEWDNHGMGGINNGMCNQPISFNQQK